MNKLNMDDVIEKLREYAELEDSELGELCISLMYIYESYRDYICSNQFKKFLEFELRCQLKNFQKNSEIKKIPCVNIRGDEKCEYTVKELNWIC